MPFTYLNANVQPVDMVQRYGQGARTGAYMGDLQYQRMQRVQDMNMRQRKMDMAAQEMEQKRQQEAMARFNQYGADIAPVIKDIMDLPESQRSAAYTAKIPALREIAAQNGIVPEKAVSPTWDSDKASALVQKYYQAPDLGFAKIDPSKHTPESIAAYEKSGKRGDLVSVDSENSGYRILTPEESAAQGYSPNVVVQEEKSTGKQNVTYRPPSSTNLGAKEKGVARNKILAAQRLRNEIQNVKDMFYGNKDKGIEGVKGTASTGFLQYLPTESRDRYDKAVDNLRSTVTALTRVPGVGAMSDYETRLDQAKMPTTGVFKYEQTMEDQIKYLEDLADQIETGYVNMLGDESQVEAQGESNQNIPQVNDKGWTLMTDANGNKAYVSPDGQQYEEVK